MATRPGQESRALPAPGFATRENVCAYSSGGPEARLGVHFVESVK